MTTDVKAVGRVNKILLNESAVGYLYCGQMYGSAGFHFGPNQSASTFYRIRDLLRLPTFEEWQS